MMKIKSFASGFSGYGGADLGLRAAGLEHAWGQRSWQLSHTAPHGGDRPEHHGELIMLIDILTVFSIVALLWVIVFAIAFSKH